MLKKTVLVLSLLLFALSSFPEDCFLNFDVSSQAFASTDVDRSQSSHDVSGLRNRLVRGKLSIKNLSTFNTATNQIRLAGWINEASFSTPFCKYSVFQRINVFRL
jgi:hypothetical protein